jgi:hypothetical protein
VRYLAYLYGVTLTSADAQGRRVAAASAALVAVLLIDVIGLPRIGLVAPVISAYTASIMVLGAYSLFVQRRFGTIGLAGSPTVLLVGGAIIGVLAALAMAPIVPAAAAAVVGAAVYLVLTWAGPLRADVRALLRADRR